MSEARALRCPPMQFVQTGTLGETAVLPEKLASRLEVTV